MTEPDEPKFKWITLHGQRVRVTICPPGKANARRVLSELRDDPNTRYEQQARSSGIAKSSHDGGHSHPCGHEADDDAELEGEIRQTRGGLASGWDVTSKGLGRNSKGGRTRMNHYELKILGGSPLGVETKEQGLFRRERAKRLMALARQHGPERLAGITVEQLALMAPALAVTRLGLPPSVLLDELRRLAPPIPPVPPLPAS